MPPRNLAVILDEAISSLTYFDSVRLEALEQEAELLSTPNFAPEQIDIESVVKNTQLLAGLLTNCDANLNALKRLHARNRIEAWVR